MRSQVWRNFHTPVRIMLRLTRCYLQISSPRKHTETLPTYEQKQTLGHEAFQSNSSSVKARLTESFMLEIRQGVF